MPSPKNPLLRKWGNKESARAFFEGRDGIPEQIPATGRSAVPRERPAKRAWAFLTLRRHSRACLLIRAGDSFRARFAGRHVPTIPRPCQRLGAPAPGRNPAARAFHLAEAQAFPFARDFPRPNPSYNQPRRVFLCGSTFPASFLSVAYLRPAPLPDDWPNQTGNELGKASIFLPQF
jgi:hypothetical protein